MYHFATSAALPAELLRSIDTYLGRWGIALLLIFLLLALLGNLLLKRRMQHNRALLQTNKEMLATILDSVDAFIYIKSPTLEYQYVNRRISDLFGLPADKIIGKCDAEFFDAGSAAEMEQVDRSVLASGKKVTVEESNVLQGESQVRTFLSIKMPLSMSPGAPPSLCGISTELTDYLEMQSRTYYLAFYDSLTGLPNRRMLMDSLTAAIDHDEWSASYSAVLVIDLDNFRLVNDIQGHESGDHLLINVAEQLRQRLEPEATLARFSSDEFVVLLNNLGEPQTEAFRKAERVSRQLLETIAQVRSGHSLPISASIGIALFTGREHSMDSVLQQADMALQQAKRAGGNTLCFFNTDMQTSVLERASLEADLHKALERNELALHYQVQVDHQGVTTGVEALLRWYHPQRGWVSPATFIPLAEENRLIVPIGYWVLRSACEQLAKWSIKRPTPP